MPPIVIQKDSEKAATAKIVIKNLLLSAVQTKISSATTPGGDEKFWVLDAEKLADWTRGSAEVLFTNGSGQGLLDTTYVLPGEKYDVKSTTTADPNRGSLNFDYTPCPDHRIGVRNNLNSIIQVSVSNATNSRGSAQFFSIPAGSDNLPDPDPGTIDPWTRSGPEVIYVKHPDSQRVITYLGVLGQNLDINKPLTSIDARNDSTPGTDGTIIVHNYLGAAIEVAVSNTSNSEGSARFWTIPAKTDAVPGSRKDSWVRSGPELIYVKDTITSRVAVYYGSLGTILNIREIGA